MKSTEYALMTGAAGTAVAAMVLTYGAIFDQAMAGIDQVVALLGG